MPSEPSTRFPRFSESSLTPAHTSVCGCQGWGGLALRCMVQVHRLSICVGSIVQQVCLPRCSGRSARVVLHCSCRELNVSRDASAHVAWLNPGQTLPLHPPCTLICLVRCLFPRLHAIAWCRQCGLADGPCLDVFECFSGVGAVCGAFRELGYSGQVFDWEANPDHDDMLSTKGFLRSLCVTLRLSPRSLLYGGVPCSSWVVCLDDLSGWVRSRLGMFVCVCGCRSRGHDG